MSDYKYVPPSDPLMPNDGRPGPDGTKQESADFSSLGFNPDDYGNPADDGIPSTWNDLVNAYLNGGPAPPGMTLKQIRALNAAVRGEIREPRQLCNASGGLVAKAGNACYFGQEAVDFANGLLEEDSPDSLKDKAQRWLDSNSNNIVDGQWSEEEDDVSSITDAEAIQEVLAQIPEKLKGYVTEENIIEVLKTLGGIEDPMTAIKRGMIGGIEFEFPKDWREWTVFGTLSIPGVPLPPGIVDVTLGDIADAVGSIGGKISDFIEDPLGELDKIKDWVLGEVRGVFGGDKDDPGWGGSMGGFGDWVNGIFGKVIGGTIIGTIYDEVSGYFEGSDPPAPPVGGEDDDDDNEDADKTPQQGDDIADFAPDFELAGDKELEGDGFDDDDDDDDSIGGPSVSVETEDYDPEVYIPGGGNDDDDDDDSIGGTDLNDPTPPPEIGGGSSPSFAGGGGSSNSSSQPTGLLTGITANPELLSKLDFPITNYLSQGILSGGAFEDFV